MKMNSKVLAGIFAATTAALGAYVWLSTNSKRDVIDVFNKAGGCKILVINGKKSPLLCPYKTPSKPVALEKTNGDCGLGAPGSCDTPEANAAVDAAEEAETPNKNPASAEAINAAVEAEIKSLEAEDAPAPAAKKAPRLEF